MTHDTERPTLVRDDYPPLSDYAVIGDCRCAALVARNGSIDWLCLPDFSSPSVFAALLDRMRGGRFVVRPRGAERTGRTYRGRSAVVDTTFECEGGVVRLTDFMPIGEAPSTLVRRVECIEGEATVDILFAPRPDYACTVPTFRRCGEGWGFRHDGQTLILFSDIELRETDGALTATRRLAAGECLHWTLVGAADANDWSPCCADPERALRDCLAWWDDWCSRCSYDGPWRDMVLRSCLTLKLMSCRDSGAVMAALTASLPESYSADRNWDYRYCWLRDTSMLLQSFLDMGFRRESKDFLGWLLQVGHKPHTQPLYDLYGRPAPDERVLEHLEGYRGHGPVRVGNKARSQLQLDIYGDVVQTAYRFVLHGGTLSTEARELLATLGSTVCRLWRRPDHSIWEPRAPERHYTYSKLMCWVALDRLLGLHERVPLDIDAVALRRERDLIRAEIEQRGFNAQLNSYVGYFGGSEPDASLQLMLRYGYLEPGEARLAGTFDYIMRRLSSRGLLYRYPPDTDYDGIAGGENLFAVCSFWTVDYLARSGDKAAAVRLFERLIGLANDVGLYAEQFDCRDLSLVGNFPQAFSHAGLVTAAIAIAESVQGQRGAEIDS